MLLLALDEENKGGGSTENFKFVFDSFQSVSLKFEVFISSCLLIVATMKHPLVEHLHSQSHSQTTHDSSLRQDTGLHEKHWGRHSTATHFSVFVCGVAEGGDKSRQS